MAFNISFEDSSPLLRYDPISAWTDTPHDASPYSGSSFHTTATNGASVSFSFNGTDIWLYGAEKPEYGTYTLSIDGQQVSLHDASSPSPMYQQLLGSVNDLEMGSHTVTLTSTGGQIDIDYVTFQTVTKSSNTGTLPPIVDDTHSIFEYGSEWSYGQHNGFWNNTIHYTQSSDAKSQFSFDGDAVAIYGSVGPSMGNYTISLDGVDHQLNAGSDGTAEVIHAQTLLYVATGLTDGSHNVIITANPSQLGDPAFFELDSAVVAVASPEKNAIVPGRPSANLVPAASSSTILTNKGVIVAAALSGAISLLGVIFLSVFCTRRHKIDPPSYLEKAEKDQEDDFTPVTPGLPIQDADKVGSPEQRRPPAYDNYTPYASYHESMSERSTVYSESDVIVGMRRPPRDYTEADRTSGFSNFSRNSTASFDSGITTDSRRILIDNKPMPPQFSKPQTPSTATIPSRPSRKRDTMQIPF